MILDIDKSIMALLMLSGMVGAEAYAGHNTNAPDSVGSVKTLQELVVTGEGAERNLKAAEMGTHSLSGQMILNLPVMFGEPDIVKALQSLPGVSPGIEGFTGLYVRGGDNDQNLFLYQDLPLYQVSHLGGIFSSFNVATVNKVDFYKAAFPSKYGGRISSITDIRMNRPDFEKFHGRVSVGLLSANAYVSGPIIKNKTAFSAAIRRSWIDIVSIPTLAIMNAVSKKDGKKHIAYYNFTDFNARIDHKFNSRANTYIVGYYGHDDFKIGLREFEGEDNENAETSRPDENPDENKYFDENTNKLSWGNWGIIGAFNYSLNKGALSASVYYSDYASKYRQSHEYQSDLSDPDTYGYNRSVTKNRIRDVGIKANYIGDLSNIYTLDTGIGFIHHNYLPQGLINEWKQNDKSSYNNLTSPQINAEEAYVYADNNFKFGERVSLSAGVRGSIYNVSGHSFLSIEPRGALRVMLSQNYSVKMGYARMTQYVQQVSNNYISLPTDLWQPIVPGFSPLKSDQYSVGVYGTLPYSMYFSVEGWYKRMHNLLEYKEGLSVLKEDVAWQDKLTSGNGESYGVDINLVKDAGPFTGSIGYGLMWNWRKFADLNLGERFPAKFDNRHKININLAYRLNKNIEFNAGWVYMTGNRITLSMYNYDMVEVFFPDAPGAISEDVYYLDNGIGYYPSRNNVRLPAYHRLDLGMNINRYYKNGRKGVWNISIYNAYCHMNAMTIIKDPLNDYLTIPDKKNWHRAFKTLSFIPIIPSVSYTYIF